MNDLILQLANLSVSHTEKMVKKLLTNLKNSVLINWKMVTGHFYGKGCKNSLKRVQNWSKVSMNKISFPWNYWLSRIRKLMNGSWNILSNKIISTSMVESHTISKAIHTLWGTFALVKYLKWCLKMVLIVRVWYILIENHQKVYGNTIFCKKILIMCRFSSNFHMVKERS